MTDGDDKAIRDVVTRLARRHESGGTVIERAAIVAEGAESQSIVAWIVAHDGQPEFSALARPSRGAVRRQRGRAVQPSGTHRGGMCCRRARCPERKSARRFGVIRRPLRQPQSLFLDEPDHLPVRDEISLGVRCIREKATADRQPVLVGPGRLLVDPGPVDSFSGDETYRGLDLRAGAVTEAPEHAGSDFQSLLWVHISHRCSPVGTNRESLAALIRHHANGGWHQGSAGDHQAERGHPGRDPDGAVPTGSPNTRMPPKMAARLAATEVMAITSTARAELEAAGGGIEGDHERDHRGERPRAEQAE